MITFHNYFDLLNYVYKNGQDLTVRNLKIKEIINVNLTLNNPLECLFYINDTKITFDYVSNYLKGELCWYFSGENCIKNIKKYSIFWNKICDKNGLVNSNYGYHVFYKKISNNMTNYKNCLNILKKDVYSRRSIILYNEPFLMFNNEKDYLCTQNQQFLIRNDYVHSIVTIRSSDAIFGLTYDIPWWSLVQQKVAKDLNKKVGFLSINIGSSHIYENFYDIFKYIKNSNCKTGTVKLKKDIILNKSFQTYEKILDKIVTIKK